MSYPFNATWEFPTKCRACGREFEEKEERVGIVRAGAAWGTDRSKVTPDGRRILAPVLDGDELYRTEAYHLQCAPPDTREASNNTDTRIGPAEVGGEVAPAPDRRRPASAEERVGGADNTERKP